MIKNFKEAYQLYKDNLNWTPQDAFFIHEFKSEIEPKSAITYEITFLIGFNLFKVKAYKMNLDYKLLTTYQTLQEFEAYLTMEELLGKQVFEDIFSVEVTNLTLDIMKKYGGIK
jgi:hypothetical protein